MGDFLGEQLWRLSLSSLASSYEFQQVLYPVELANFIHHFGRIQVEFRLDKARRFCSNMAILFGNFIPDSSLSWAL